MNIAVPSPTRFLFVLFAVPAFAGSPVEGIKNFHQVDEHVYRGGQPDHQGFLSLAHLGVKTIVDLREPGSRSSAEEADVTADGMKYINVPMTGLTPPSEAEMNKLLGILEDNNQGPVFVHCMRGADRTGAVIAAYRIQHDRWENTRALKEAESLGMSFFQFPRKKFIRAYQARAIEAQAAPPATATPSTATANPAVTAR